jgi:hypothetical protein
MQNTLEVHHVSVAIERSPDDVYRYAANVETWPEWASGLGKSMRKVEGAWIIDGPMGQVKMKMTEPNNYRVLDHDVTLPSGQTVHNAFRVLPNGNGSEAVFSVFRQNGVSDEDFAADWAAVEKDLHTLKRVLEKR